MVPGAKQTTHSDEKSLVAKFRHKDEAERLDKAWANKVGQGTQGLRMHTASGSKRRPYDCAESAAAFSGQRGR
jgi:uncharacterized protein YifE (UPF0438 family)